MDDLARLLGEAAGPRTLPAYLREQMEALILTGGTREVGLSFRGIDAPRELPLRLVKRLKQTFRRETSLHPRVLPLTLAVASVLLLFANTTVLMSGRFRPAGPIAIVSPQPSTSSPPASPPPQPPSPMPPGSLESFPTAYQFLRYVRTEALGLVTAYGIMHPEITESVVAIETATAAAPRSASGGAASDSESGAQPGEVSQDFYEEAFSAEGSQFSTTNVQEAGVDEPDRVKNDGNRIAVMSGGKIALLQITRNELALKATVDAPGGVGLLLAGERLIHLGSITKQAHPSQSPSPANPQRTWTKVTVVDVSRLAGPKVLSSVEVEGSYVGARLAGGVVRLVVQSAALGPPLSQPVPEYSPESLNAATEANKQAIKRSVVGHWLPHYVFERRGSKTQTGHVHEWNAISKPPDRAGLSMVTVLTIDPADPKPDNAVSVIGAGDIIYSSLSNLYVTSNRLDDVIRIQQGGFPKAPVTRIHKFDISDPDAARYVASGEVPGFLLNQFSLSERDGLLRVATTLGFAWMPPQQGTSESFVTILAEKDRKLVPIGSVGNIGKGERIYSVRFVGSQGYVVTFRQIDPLHVIDLSNPERPELKGELKVPGYSGYLHPLSATLLLGIGRSADESGQLKGVQFSLFDVSDPSDPRLLHQRAEGDHGSSSVEQDHHGFLYWDPKHLMVVPAEIESQSGPPFYGALALKVEPDSGFGDPVRLTHAGRPGSSDSYAQISRSIVIGANLLTVSSAGILVSDLDSFAEKYWQPLPH